VSETNLVEDIAPPHQHLRGDLTQGPILRALVMFSIPALIGNILQTIGGSINAIWVGQLLGETAVAATANANIIMFLMFGTVFGFGMATTIMVGQNFGARKLAAARRSFGAGIGFCTALAVAIAVLGWFYAEDVLHLLATPKEAQAPALAYLRITFLSMPFGALSMMVSMGLRGAGDSTTPMASMILTVVLGIVLNPVLILGLGPFPALGIAGSALAGAIASIVGSVWMIATIYWRDLPLRLRGEELGFLIPNKAELAFMFAKGVPMGAQTMLSSAAGLVMVGLVNREGMMATAAYGASLQLWNYIQMPAFAVGSAVSTMVAQNIGARQHDRVGEITMAGLVATSAVTIVITALILLFDTPVLGLFLGHGSHAVPLARHIQFVTTWSFLLQGVMMVLFATMRAYGAVITPLIIMFVSMYPARLGFYQLAYPVMGSEAVWWSYPVGAVVSAVLTLLFYRYGPWRKAQREAMAPAG
jgi:putative MATE family efflux protein